MLTLLTNAPEGDFLWKIMLHAIAFPYAYRMSMPMNDFPQFEDAALSKKLYSFQWWFTQKMIMPAFDERYIDKGFDSQVNEYISRFDNPIKDLIGVTLVTNIVYKPYIEVLRDRNFYIGRDDEDKSCPIVAEAFKEESLYLAERNDVLLTIGLTDFLDSNKEKLYNNLSTRFSDTENMTSSFNNVVNANKEHDEETLIEWEENILDIYKSMTGEELGDKRDIDNWELQEKEEASIAGEQYEAYYFTPESFPHKLGINRVEIVQKNEHTTIYFQSSDEHNFSLYVTFDTSGQRTALYPSFRADSRINKTITDLGKSILYRLAPEKSGKKKLTSTDANAISSESCINQDRVEL